MATTCLRALSVNNIMSIRPSSQSDLMCALSVPSIWYCLVVIHYRIALIHVIPIFRRIITILHKQGNAANLLTRSSVGAWWSSPSPFHTLDGIFSKPQHLNTERRFVFWFNRLPARIVQHKIHQPVPFDSSGQYLSAEIRQIVLRSDLCHQAFTHCHWFPHKVVADSDRLLLLHGSTPTVACCGWPT